LERLAFLSAAWCAAVATLGPLPGDRWGGGPIAVDVVVTEGPRAETRVSALFAPGLPVTVSPAPAPPADLVLTLGREDAVALGEGWVRLDTAYMRGQVKLAGDQSLVLRLLAASATSAWDEPRARLAAMTDFGPAPASAGS
jgi:hypothetical protein